MWQERIKAIRAAGYKLREIGECCGLGRATIHDISTGRSKSPSKDAAPKLLRMYQNVQRRNREQEKRHADAS